MASILLGLCSCFLGLTIFIVHEIAQGRSTSTISTMLKMSLVSFAVEFIGLSALYYWIIFHLVNEKWYRQYLMLFALGTTIFGLLTAIFPVLIDLVHQVDLELALWVSNINNSF